MTIEIELTQYLEKMQQFDKDSAQDGQILYAYLIELSQIMARSNLIMAQYQKKFREEKKQAYYKLAASSQATQKYYSATLAKDFIDSQCSDSGYVFDLAERCSRAAVHTSDSIRTIVSSLKSERIFSNYGT